MNKQNLEIYTLCRSGNHAIIFWLIHNICDIEKLQKYDGMCYWNDDCKLYFYNNCNHINYNYYVDNYNYLIKSYEDINNMNNTNDTNNTNKKIIIVRDYCNFLSSRYQKYNNLLGLNSSYLQNYDDIKNLWIQLCYEIINNNAIGIIYNKWLLDKDYRDNIGKIINIPNINDNITYVSDIGEGSSFIGVKLDDNNNYLKRFNKDLFVNNIELFEKIKYDFENDKDIKYIHDTLFKN
ncbi:hypothetical protein Hokovirus_3_224 [Hokovirus HKV1]|uniref:Uncharacterized protein n=1 Tax=Hokovirus HKV1 TaxID=1977638 RepID=A0A1V0SH11_9VIRU|nr:hypothetical protein Hokovirus_3_224 [Hokovirus HKV1]